MWAPTGWQWLPFLLAVWLGYELLRHLVVSSAKRRYEAQVDKFLKQHDIPTDSFRHTHRVVVKERVMSDPGLVVAMGERARADGATMHEVQARVRGWLDEIVPQFNILAYYKVGYAFGRTAAYSVYNVHLDKQSLDAARAKIPEGASVVYVSNHRSNADFVVTGFMLSKSVQISYAVGEWARVWPLESLFKAFGSYFVRRGEKDPLYHRTLEAYLQLITKQGVTQAMFPEGGLTRDGALRPAKVGLLDNMAKAKLDPDFDAPLVFVPVGINFDRVMEDENMVYEAKHGRPRYKKRSISQKIWRLISLIGKLVWFWPINVARFMAKRLKKHGVAAIHFGEPVVFDEWYAAQEPFLASEDRKHRWDKLQPFADGLLARIQEVIPATPVTLTCLAMQRVGKDRMEAGVDRGAILQAIKQVRDELAGAGTPLAVQAYGGRRGEHVAHDQVTSVTDGVDDVDVLERILKDAMDVIGKRGLLTCEDRLWRSQRWDLVAYYARSLQGHSGQQAGQTQTDDGAAANQAPNVALENHAN